MDNEQLTVDKENPASLSIVHCQLSIVGRVVRLADGREFPLDSLTDFGFLVLEEERFAIARLFRAPDGTRLLADARAFDGGPEAAFERLWHGHFKRNFFLVGMEEDSFHATAELRETVFAACAERAERLTAPAARNLQIGHFEQTPDGLRRILPRGDSPTVPPLVLRPVQIPADHLPPEAGNSVQISVDLKVSISSEINLTLKESILGIVTLSFDAKICQEHRDSFSKFQ
jgi:hypothetical protein